MNSAIGITSASIDQCTASVWNRNEPIPTIPVRMASASAGGSPRTSARRQSSAAAIRKAALVSALTGSAQKAGPVRSQ